MHLSVWKIKKEKIKLNSIRKVKSMAEVVCDGAIVVHVSANGGVTKSDFMQRVGHGQGSVGGWLLGLL